MASAVASLNGVEAPRFSRDRLTWLGYISISTYGFYVYALGPVVAFLRQDKLDMVLIATKDLLTAGVDTVTSATYGPIDMGRIRVELVTLKSSTQAQDAEAFAKFVASPHGAEVFAKFAFSPASGPAPGVAPASGVAPK